MPLVLKNRVKSTTTTTGTGTITLGAAATGYQSFSAIVPNAAWSVTSAAYLQQFSVAAQDTAPSGLFFKPDGTKMYIAGGTGVDINEYNLSTAWNISTASYLQNFSVSGQTSSPQDVFFKPDGLKMYVLDLTNDAVLEYDLSSAWNISTASYLQNFSVTSQESSPQGFFFKDDGTKMYVIGITGDDVNEYNLGTAWNVSTASYVQVFSVATQEDQPRTVFFKPDGLKMYIAGAGNNSVYEYSLSSAWDVSTASYSQYTDLKIIGPTTSINVLGIFFKPDGLKMYVAESQGDSVYEYNLGSNQTYYVIKSSTEWEVGLGTVTDAGATLSRDLVFGSSNSGEKVNFSAGTKDVLCAYPAAAMPLGVPFCDDNEIGTDLSGWTAFQAALNNGVTGGTTFGNNNTNGVVSTFNLIYTVADAYRGGVLAPNGDIHFVPHDAIRGQKVSSTGVVSTYSLVYTAGSYWGGVLASNGDIHFVPYTSPRGQKISASGVVSTYSLVNTAASYAGGVLAPNGDIQFIPRGAPVGQKVSSAGVVSTYSLVYTTGNAYTGGVLAPNGDIHFIPYSGVVGQKISAAGVISTYSLVYTTSFAYYGGVLAPNGDIHFVPYQAQVGQKVSAAGVVSTYSLVYTTSFAYLGGVLAPNGDIHFVPFSAASGQKVSAAGVVSTYSLLFTTSFSYAGGTLNANGNIYFIPNSANRGQSISTNPGSPLGPGVCLSSFLNKF
jgi:sugar lactone lactonase YvrE